MRGRKVKTRTLVVAGSHAVKKAAEAEGLDRIFREAGAEWREPGCSMCLAMNGDMLAARPVLRLDVEPELRGAPGARRADAAREPRDRGGRGRLGRGRGSAPAGGGLGHGTRSAPSRAARSSSPRENIDTDQIIPGRFLKVTDKKGLGKGLFSDWRYDADGKPRAGLRPQPPRGAGLPRPRRRRQLRLRLVPRARAVGARRLRLPGGHLDPHRRHLPQQRAQERAPPGRARAGGGREARRRARREGPHRPRRADGHAAGRDAPRRSRSTASRSTAS